jgi:hypothetical protein
VRRCDGNSDSVSVNANCFPHALGFRDWWCTCQFVISPPVVNTDRICLISRKAAPLTVIWSLEFVLCPDCFFIIYLFIYIFLGDQLLEEFQRKRKSNFSRDPSFSFFNYFFLYFFSFGNNFLS